MAGSDSVNIWIGKERIQELIREAKEQMTHAYAPYSHFKVGAALRWGLRY